jgi:hypothetical protein
MGVSRELALKIAAAFGGGMSSHGEVCGAVSGALMALGLRFAASCWAGISTNRVNWNRHAAKTASMPFARPTSPRPPPSWEICSTEPQHIPPRLTSSTMISPLLGTSSQTRWIGSPRKCTRTNASAKPCETIPTVPPGWRPKIS